MGKGIKKIYKNQKGLTLIEVMIALLLLSLIAMTFLHVFLNAFDNSIKAQGITNYTYATQGVIEELRSDNYVELLQKARDVAESVPFDTNGDGTDDCYMKFTVAPYGIMDETSNGKEGAFVHMIYLGDMLLIIDGDGNIIYTSATADPIIELNVDPNGNDCTLTVNGNTVVFERPNQDRHVAVITNLNYKDYGYTSYLKTTGDIGHVFNKAYGTEEILDEYDGFVDPQEFFGVNNNNVLLAKIKVELYHDADDTVPFYDMFEIVEVSLEGIEDFIS